MLDGPDGERLRQELEHILGRALKARAPRRQVKRMVRLIGAHYDEVVLLKDVSSSGVRLLVRGDTPFDLRDTTDMTLVVKLPSGPRRLRVVVVRLCGQDGPHLDLACRFAAESEGIEAHLAEIRSYMFGKA